MNKKRLHKGAVICLLALSLTLSCGFTTFRGETGEGHAGVFTGKTPINPERGGTLWTRSFSFDGKTTYNSDPIVTESCIYIASGNKLYTLGLDGSIQGQSVLSGAINTTCHPLLQDSHLFLPLSGGRIQCVNITTMSSEWTSEGLGGQSLSTLYYRDALLYAGTTEIINGSQTKGVFYCLDTSDGSVKWTYEDTEHPGGYYWSGAISRGNALYFSGDNGILVSHSLTGDTVYDTYRLTENAHVRAGITYDAPTDALYTTSTDGIIYKITVSDSGKIGPVQKAVLVPGASAAGCTSTPTIYNNRIYVGCAADQYGYLSVFNALSLNCIYTVKGNKGGEIKSSPLVSAGYSSGENHRQVYVYTTFNQMPGGIYFIRDDENAASSSFQTLYEPASAMQYCMSSVTPGNDGTLYYSNDSGTLFAVSDVDKSSDRPDPGSREEKNPGSQAGIDAQGPQNTGSQGAPSPKKESSSGKSKNTTISEKPKKPDRIKIKKKKHTILLSWRKRTNKSQTVIYTRYGRGKWKKKILPSKKKIRIKRKKKNLKVRLRSRIRKGGKWIYSGYTKTIFIRH